jgi:hypothetical protein
MNVIFEFSPTLRLCYNSVMGEESRAVAKKLMQDTADELIRNKEVADSLRVLSPVGTQTRQIDIRSGEKGDPTSKIMFKCFCSWGSKQECWIFRVEMGDENYWEETLGRIPNGQN